MRHPKTYDLASRLQCGRAEAIGYLTLLWDFTEDHAIQGNVGKWPNGAIARACEWSGDADAFVAAMVASGWLDEDDTHRLVIHDWQDHCQTWVRAKLTKSGLPFVSSAPVATIEATIEPTIEATTCAPVPNRTEPNLAEPSRTEPIPAEPRGSSNEEPCAAEPRVLVGDEAPDKGENRRDEILAVLAHYRMHHPKAFPQPHSGMKEWRKIRDRLRDGYDVTQLCAAIDGNHRSPWHCGENERQREYHALELILRDADHVNQFLAIPVRAPPAMNQRSLVASRSVQNFIKAGS